MSISKKLLWAAIVVLGAISFAVVALTRGEPVNAAWLLTAAVCIFFISFRFYGLWIANKVLGANAARQTPAYRRNDGLVLFNRFYEPDIDLTRMTLVSCLELSSAYEMRLPLLWVGVLAGRLKASLAASTGVDRADDVVKYLLAGADVVMTTSSLLRHGIGHVQELLGGLETWLDARDLDSLATVRGRLSHRNVVDAGAFERANYIKTLQAYKSA